MTVKSDYDQFVSAQQKLQQHPMGHFFFEQERRYVKPFCLYGNLHYVGDNWVCAHILDTGAGLILFDAGNIGATAMLIQAIWEAGFNPADVKWMVLSHAHVDHIGAAPFFQTMFGTQIYLGAPDADLLATRPEWSFLQDAGDIQYQPFRTDVAIQDGDLLTFGDTQIQFYLVPGHTEGCIACFFDVHDGNQTKRVGYYGGFGFNTLQKGHLCEYGDADFSMRERYLASLAKVRNQPVDIFMPNHTNNVNLLEKREALLADPTHNPFVDETAWGRYLDEKRNALVAFMNDPHQC